MLHYDNVHLSCFALFDSKFSQEDLNCPFFYHGVWHSLNEIGVKEVYLK